MKTAVVFEGPGFSEQGDVLRNLGFAGARQAQKTLLGPLDEKTSGDVAAADFVVLRGPWSLSPEERLLSATQALRLRTALKAEAGPAILGIGRGALIMLDLLLGNSVSWKPHFENESRWVRLKTLLGGSETMVGLVLGRAIPRLPDLLPSGQRITPWLATEAGETVGWRIGDRIWLSPLDVLAYAERTQLPDFGYSDLTQILTQAQVLERFVKGDWA